MNLLEHPLAGGIAAWPASMDVKSVQAHKSHLILQGDLIEAASRGEDDALLARAVFRGAAVWEQWLLAHGEEPVETGEARAVSALSLAERAGDWPFVAQLLDEWARAGRPTHRHFYRELRARADRNRAPWTRAMEALARLQRRSLQDRAAASTAALREAVDGLAREMGAPRQVASARGRLAVLADPQGWGAAGWYWAALCIADPMDPDAIVALSSAAGRQDPKRAVEVLRAGEAIANGDPEYLAFRSRFEWELWSAGARLDPPPTGFARAALRATSQRRDLHPHIDIMATGVAAVVFSAAGDPTEAVQVLEAAIERHPSSGVLFGLLGVSCLDLGDIPRARNALATAARLMPSEAMLEGLLGGIALTEGDPATAVTRLESALSRARAAERGALLNDLGVAFARAGRRDDALRTFDEAIALMPDDPRPRANRALAEGPTDDREFGWVRLVDPDRFTRDIMARLSPDELPLAA